MLRSGAVFLIGLLALAWSTPTQAAEQSSISMQPTPRVTLDLERVPLAEAIERIADQGGFHVVYRPDLIPPGATVSLLLRDAPREDALRRALEGHPLQVVVSGNTAILTAHEVPDPPQPEQRQLEGIVVDGSMDRPLAGARVSVEGTQHVTLTNREGRFSLNWTPDSEFTLVVSQIGYRPHREVYSPADGLAGLRIALAPDPFQAEAIVVTGLASARERSVAEVSVARIDAEDLSSRQLYTSFDQLVTGRIPGVQLHPAAGYAGGGFRFFVRGGGGLQGSGQPVVIVDGIRMDDSDLSLLWDGGQGYSNLLSLSPSEIESIDVLKGPAAAAMYGTNASNGVVLITTKSGRGRVTGEGEVAFNYKLNVGQNTMPFNYDPGMYRNADLYNSILRSGTIRTHNLEASGGTGVFRWLAAYENSYEEGTAPSNHQRRNAGRVNLSAVPNDRFSISLSGAYSENDIERPHSDDAVLSPHWNTIMVDTPWKWYDSIAVASISSPSSNSRLAGGAQVTLNVTDGLELFGGLGVDNTQHRQSEFYPPEYQYWMGFGGRKRVAERSNVQHTFDVRGSYSYEPTPGLSVTSTVGSQLFDRETVWSGAENRQFASQFISDIGSGSTHNSLWEGRFQERQAGIYTTHTLSYQDTYFSTLSLRRDYASAVGEDAPSIVYPQASFAVRLDRFDFMPEVLNLFKLRAAYGESGQLPGPRDTKRLLWGASGTAYGSPGAIPSQMGNPALEPERIRELELGLDTEIANQWAVELTYYSQSAVNSIVGRPNAPSTGFGNILVPFNIGKVRGQGIEASLGGDLIRSPDYGLNFNLIWNWQENEVVDLGGQGPLIAAYQVNAIDEGLPKHEYFAVVTTGAHFDDAGVYAGAVESDGRVRLGNPIPDHTASFMMSFRFLRDFSLSGMAEWGLGGRVFSIFRQFAARNGGYVPFAEMAARLGLDDEWGWITSVDFDAITPLTPGTPEYIELAHEFARQDPFYRGNYIFDADYFVVRELSLSYDATDLMSRVGPFSSNVRGMTIGLAAKNLLRRSSYRDADFEVNAPGARSSAWGVDYGTLPPPRVFNFWVNLSF